MRPLRLEIEGFTCYREKQVIDFSRLHLFAIAGPTGAGKSSILDAITYALYGQIHRLGKQNLNEFISLGATKAHVLFEFAHSGKHYRTVRTLSRSGARKAQLEEITPGRERTIADSVTGVTTELRTLLSIDYDSFTQSVLLPQGEFARFLKSDPKDQREILRNLLRLNIYEEMRKLAAARHAELENKLGMIEAQLGMIPNATREVLQLKQAEAQRTAAAAEKQSQLSDQLQQELAIAEATWTLLKERTQKQADLDRLNQQQPLLGSLRAKLDRSQLAAQFLPALEQHQSAQLTFAKVTPLIAALAAQLHSIHTHAVTQAEKTTVALAQAQEAFDAAQTHNAAHQLRAHLHTGEDCPVCGQTITKLPVAAPPPDLQQAKTNLQSAQQRHTEAQRLLTSAQNAIDSIAPTPSTASATITDPTPLRRQYNQHLSDRHNAESTLQTVAAQLVASPFAGPAAARQELLTSAQKSNYEATLNDHQKNTIAVESRLAELNTQLAATTLTEAALLQLRQSARDAKTNTQTLTNALGRLESELANLAANIQKAETLRAELTTTRSTHHTFKLLANDLKSSNFQSFLLEGAFQKLVAGASIRLRNLNPRYELSFQESKFQVIDHDNAAQPRSADTLSGGETFLASLSLALELSDQLQQAAGAIHLDSLFIDEGFGTLDPETLATVADAIESLSRGNRMVGVITHVSELHRRLPRLEVQPSPQGSRVTFVEEDA